MASIIIRDMPQRTYDLLKARAKRNRRSMSKEALVIIEQALGTYDGEAAVIAKDLPKKTK